MKLLLVLALVCVAAQSTWATGDDLGGVFASMDGPIAQATESYGTFMQTTANGIVTIVIIVGDYLFLSPSAPLSSDLPSLWLH